MGNPTTYRDRTLTWQGRRLLTYAKDGKSATYTYDFNGIRTSKTLNGGNKAGTLTVNYIYDGNNLVAEQRGTKWITYFYGVDGVAGFEYDNVIYLYRKNVQGDITYIYKKLSDGKLELVAQYVYDAWGNHDVLDAKGNKVDPTAETIANINPFRYRGYYFDAETNLYYLQTRYYDPELGRFISSDSIGYLDPETLGGLNLYAYCGNKPVMNADPIGTFFLACVIAGLIIGAIVGATISGVKAAQEGATGLEIVGAVFCGAIIGGACGAVAGAIIGVGGAIISSGLGMISGAGGLAALAGGGTLAAGAALGVASVGLGTIVVGGGIATAGLGVLVVLASSNRLGNNQAQNKQMRDALRSLGENPNNPDIKDIINEVEDFIRKNKLDLGFNELKELLKSFLG